MYVLVVAREITMARSIIWYEHLTLSTFLGDLVRSVVFAGGRSSRLCSVAGLQQQIAGLFFWS